MDEEYLKIGGEIIGAAFDVRKNSGKGLRESYYQAALTYELKQRGLHVDTQVLVPAYYRGIKISDSYLADIVVENKVIIELKAIRDMKEAEISQIITYLKLSGFKLGYLINFGAKDFKLGNTRDSLPWEYGIYRIANKI